MRIAAGQAIALLFELAANSNDSTDEQVRYNSSFYFVSLSLSLSLSRIHTHTYTHSHHVALLSLSLTHSFPPSLTHSLIPSLAHSLTHSLPPALPHSLPPLPPSLTPSSPPSLTHSLLPSLTHSLLLPSLPHSLTPSSPPSLPHPPPPSPIPPLSPVCTSLQLLDTSDGATTFDLIQQLATESSRYTARKERNQQRSRFRDILQTLEGGVVPEREVKFGVESLQLDSWAK